MYCVVRIINAFCVTMSGVACQRRNMDLRLTHVPRNYHHRVSPKSDTKKSVNTQRPLNQAARRTMRLFHPSQKENLYKCPNAIADDSDLYFQFRFVYLFDLGAFQPGTAHPGAVQGMTAMLTYSEACTLGAVRFQATLTDISSSLERRPSRSYSLYCAQTPAFSAHVIVPCPRGDERVLLTLHTSEAVIDHLPTDLCKT